MSDTLEKTVLGLIMQDAANLQRALDLGLTAADFVQPEAVMLFASIVDADQASRPFDLAGLAAGLPTKLMLFATDVVTDAPTTYALGPYIAELKARSYLRRVSKIAQELVESIGRRTAFTTLARQRELLQALLSEVESAPDTAADERKHAKPIVEGLLETLEKKILAKGERSRLIRTEVEKLDSTIRGFSPGRLYVVAGRPGMGKSAFAVHCARKASAAGFATRFFTIEMPAREVMERFLSAESGIAASALGADEVDFSEEQIDRITYAAPRIADRPLWIDDRFGRSLTTLTAACRTAKRRGQLDFVVVDYLQLLKAGGSWSSRQAEMTEISGALKALAIELNVPVLAVAQLNREADEAKEGPQLRHLKDSGSIEQDCDVALLLYRESYYSAGTADSSSYIIVAKNRSGQVGKVLLDRLDLATSRFA
jgi:replicative DNA helicase